MKDTYFQCDGCGDEYKALNWMGTYPVRKTNGTEYHEPKETEYHACDECIDEKRDGDIFLGDVREGHNFWCVDYETGKGKVVKGALFSKNNSTLEFTLDFVPREDFNEDEEHIAVFLEEELMI